jgi:hypothetical protein
MTSSISFLSIIELVNNYLISNPDSYPIILSLENHCTAPYQNRMAEVLKKTLGKKLYMPTKASRKEEMPSPEKLKGRVLIKGKRPPESEVIAEETAKDESSSYMIQEDIDIYGKMFDKFKSAEHELVPDSKSRTEAENKGMTTEMPKYVASLLEVTYFHGAKFVNFEESCEMIPSHMHSIGETKTYNVAGQYADSPKLWREYNVNQ